MKILEHQARLNSPRTTFPSQTAIRKTRDESLGNEKLLGTWLLRENNFVTRAYEKKFWKQLRSRKHGRSEERKCTEVSYWCCWIVDTVFSLSAYRISNSSHTSASINPSSSPKWGNLKEWKKIFLFIKNACREIFSIYFPSTSWVFIWSLARKRESAPFSKHGTYAWIFQLNRKSCVSVLQIIGTCFASLLCIVHQLSIRIIHNRGKMVRWLSPRGQRQLNKNANGEKRLFRQTVFRIFIDFVAFVESRVWGGKIQFFV